MPDPRSRRYLLECIATLEKQVEALEQRVLFYEFPTAEQIEDQAREWARENKEMEREDLF